MIETEYSSPRGLLPCEVPEELARLLKGVSLEDFFVQGVIRGLSYGGFLEAMTVVLRTYAEVKKSPYKWHKRLGSEKA